MAIRRAQPFDATIAETDKEQTYTAQQTPMNGTLADNATITWDCDVNGQIVEVTLGGNRTIAAPTNVNPRTAYCLIVVQDGTGGRSLTWNSAYKFANGATPVVSSAPGAIDYFTFIGRAGNILHCTGKAQDVK